MTNNVENVGTYDDMKAQIASGQFEILLLPKSSNIGIINAQKALENLSIIVARAKHALQAGHYIEFISLKIQYIEFYLKIFWVTKNPAGAILDQDSRKLFGAIINECESFGFDKKIIADIKDFNETRIKAIHKYLMGGTDEQELQVVSLKHSKLGNAVYEHVINECGVVLNNATDIPEDVGTIFIAIPKLLKSPISD
ncbi:hypothetical protein ACFOET_11595 [Parapedobacter deserti]|uniref:Uncharacterized protein n=1 Tax=Parapedobacter deserti TaxID=1912957 RepID=A0ABV7JJQ7_9SPHI